MCFLSLFAAFHWKAKEAPAILGLLEKNKKAKRKATRLFVQHVQAVSRDVLRAEALTLLEADLRTLRTVLQTWRPPSATESRFYSHEADGRPSASGSIAGIAENRCHTERLLWHIDLCEALSSTAYFFLPLCSAARPCL